MTKNTPRDRVWSAALNMADEIRQGSWRSTFSAVDVRDQVEDPPSARTVRDVLATMADLGHLERGYMRGEYEPRQPGDAGDSELATEESFRSDAGDDELPEFEEMDVDGTEESFLESGPAGPIEADADTGGEEIDIATSGLSDADSSENPEEGSSTDDPHLEDTETALQNLPLPATVDRSDAIEAIRAARSYLHREGRATQRQFIRDVMPEHPLSYEVPDLQEGERYRGSWWRKVVKPGLEALPDVEKPPRGGSDWRLREENRGN